MEKKVNKLLDVIGLGIKTPTQELVKNISFYIDNSEILGVVGESGSGKSISSFALLGLLPPGLRVSGQIIWDGQSLNLTSDLIALRGREIAMVFQEPMSALNPSMKLGFQIAEVLQCIDSSKSKSIIKDEVIHLMEEVKLPRPDLLYHSFPHQISGGQQQRIVLAMALAAKPKLLIADEPTTALDVSVQAEIVLLLKQIIEKRKSSNRPLSLIFISHDLPLVASVCDRIQVMRNGEIVESGKSLDVVNHPKMPYTQGLIAAKPQPGIFPKRLPTVQDFLLGKPIGNELATKETWSSESIFKINQLELHYTISDGGFLNSTKTLHALQNITLNVPKGSSLGIVGESGSGKSTLAKALIHLLKPTSGTILFENKDISSLNAVEMNHFRRSVQYIFQNPDGALNPRLTALQTLLEPREISFGEDKNKALDKVREIADLVGFSVHDLNKFPHQFSGGQKQRICIARALMMEPKVLILDESVAALDVSIQAQVLNLLNDLKDRFSLTYIFISHDLSLVQYFCDQIVVLNKGKIEEIQSSIDLFNHPKSSYTQRLLDAIPRW